MKPIMQHGYLSRGDIHSLESDLMEVDLNKKGIKDWVVNELVYSVTRGNPDEDTLNQLIKILKEET